MNEIATILSFIHCISFFKKSVFMSDLLGCVLYFLVLYTDHLHVWRYLNAFLKKHGLPMTEQKPSEMSPHLLTPKNHQSSLRTSSNKHIKEIKVCVYNLGNPTSFLLITHFVCFLNLWLLVFLFFGILTLEPDKSEQAKWK